MPHLMSILIGIAFTNLTTVVAWHSFSAFYSSRIAIRASRQVCFNADHSYDGEVIGSNGKIGSYILHSLNCRQDPDPALLYEQYQYSRAFATPRGLAPGCLSKEGSPIYACIPSSSIRDVWDATLPSRKKDLVFLCNCIPSRHMNFLPVEKADDVTIAILHFGVSKDTSVPRASCSPASPSTVIYGKHANALAKLLEKDDIPVSVAKSAQELQSAAVKKLAWSSLMWLLCHDVGPHETPLTVKDIHTARSDKLQKLVEEIMPLLDDLGKESWNTQQNNSYQSALTTGEMMGYLETYSMSISNGHVTPNRELAMKEIYERNGLIVSLMKKAQKVDYYHLEVLRRVAGDAIVSQLLESKTSTDSDISYDTKATSMGRMACSTSSMSFLTYNTAIDKGSDATTKAVIIIGAGMIGSSIAYHLSLRDVDAIVMDVNTNILPKSPIDKVDPGTATSSSFAWLNANDKSPSSYMMLNLLGMETWKRHELLKTYPTWSGSLIRSTRSKLKENSPHYSCIGPISSDEVARLEPGIDWTRYNAQHKGTEETISYYPQEGHVNPEEAVKTLRIAAHKNGASFMEGVQINEIARDKNGHVTGVTYFDSSSEQKFLAANTIIVAAGANTTSPLIGKVYLPLKYEPGVLAFTKSQYEDTQENRLLQNIFVDTISESHILRRSDGTFVIGGGQLIVGGESTLQVTADTDTSEEIDAGAHLGSAMLRTVADSIMPLEISEVNNDTPVRTTRANRPMPLDGLPVIGFIDSSAGIYAAVTHSGITLGPLLGELVAYEVHSSLASGSYRPLLEILDDYRPSRFE